MIPAELVALGVAFYDVQVTHCGEERIARHAAVCYMRRKVADPGDAMPFYEALAEVLALRAAARIREAETAVIQTPASAQRQSSWIP